MCILFILENYHPAIGGVETLFKTLIDRLNARGVKCIIITSHQNGAPRKEDYGNVKIRRYQFFTRYGFTFLAFFPALIYGRNADLIHTTSYNAGLPASLAGFLLRKRVIITFHEVWGKMWFRLPFFSRFSKWGHYLFERFLLWLPFHRYVAVSEFTAGRLIKYHIKPSKVKTIYNGIDYKKWPKTESNVKDKPFHFIYYGRLGISKGLDLLLPAYLSIVQKHPEVRLSLVIPKTENSISKFIRKISDSLPHLNKPQLLHELSRKDLIDHLASSHCVVIPSYSEGFGFTAVETGALGLAAIISGRGSLPEVRGGNTITMKKQDVPSLVEAMEKAIDGNWVYSEPKQFYLSKTVDQYVRLYQKLTKLHSAE